MPGPDPVFARQEFGRRMGLGARPALLVIDAQVGFADPAVFGGHNIAAAFDGIAALLPRFRALGLPVAHVRYTCADDGSDAGTFGLKVPGLLGLTRNAPIARIVDGCAPMPGEFLAEKRHASAFSGTPLAPWLAFRGVDSLFVTGCTTSGCVRASVVDASAHGFRPLVLVDCVGDRAEGPHESSLFDMGQKYADLMESADAVAMLIARAKAAPAAAVTP